MQEPWVGGVRGPLQPGGSSVAFAVCSCTPPGMLVQLVGCKGHGAQGSALISKEPTHSPFQQMLGMVDTELALWGFGELGVWVSNYNIRRQMLIGGMILRHVLILGAVRKEGALPMGAWKTSWQRKHLGWALEKEAEFAEKGRKRGECLPRERTEKEHTSPLYSIG